MARMTIMVGLPGSGKTTRAKEILEKDGNTVRINRDSLRQMLHCGKWTGRNEGHTKDAARKLADWFLANGINVVIDDTNLNEGTVQSWTGLAKIHNAKIQYERMDTPIEVCIARDRERIDTPAHVGQDVIVNMALLNGIYPKPKKGFVICDIDGTIADLSHRKHFLDAEKKDWKGFFGAMEADSPRLEVIDQLMKIEGDGHMIVFVSGRPDNYREPTEVWLEKTFKGYRPHLSLIMRRAGDSRQDVEVKQEIFDKYFKDKYPIHTVIDDRPSVIRMWRANGLEVIDVGNGEEF